MEAVAVAATATQGSVAVEGSKVNSLMGRDRRPAGTRRSRNLAVDVGVFAGPSLGSRWTQPLLLPERNRRHWRLPSLETTSGTFLRNSRPALGSHRLRCCSLRGFGCRN
jgi:hypothetical protein